MSTRAFILGGKFVCGIVRAWLHPRRTRSHRMLRARDRDRVPDQGPDHHRKGLPKRRECRAHANAVDSRSSRQAYCRSIPILFGSSSCFDARYSEGTLTNYVRKLQCDIQRPCTLCLRAGATCSAAVRPTVWKNHGPGQGPKPSRLNSENVVELPAAKRPRQATSVGNVAPPAASTSPRPDSSTTTGNGIQNTRITSRDRVLSSPRETSPPPWVSSSAAVQFMEEVSKGRSCPANTRSHIRFELSNMSCLHVLWCRRFTSTTPPLQADQKPQPYPLATGHRDMTEILSLVALQESRILLSIVSHSNREMFIHVALSTILWESTREGSATVR